MNKIIDNIKSGNYEVVDNQGVSVTQHFTQCLEKEFADLETKLAESEKDRLMWQEMYKSADKQNKEICETDIYPLQEENQKLKQQLAEKESEADQRYKDWQEEIRECDGLRVVLSEVRKQLADTETQNKRVLEKLELIVSANQELEQKLADMEQEQIKEMQEHQEAMLVADRRIKELEETNKVLSNELTKDTVVKQDNLETCCGIPIFEIPKLKEENVQLKQQLADTETQNKRVLEKLELIVSANQELEQKLAESKNSLKRTIEHYEKYCSEINHQNVMLYASACNAQRASQDKISFAVEQLEKVKENIIDRLADIDRQFMEDLWDEEQYARMCWENWDTEKFIDNQIERLKEGK